LAFRGLPLDLHTNPNARWRDSFMRWSFHQKNTVSVHLGLELVLNGMTMYGTRMTSYDLNHQLGN
jgi:hypothetical protein